MASQRRNLASAASSEGGDREVVEDEPAVPASGAAGPIAAVERVRRDADLGGQMPDHRRGEVGLLVGKAAVLAPVGELRGQAEPAGVGEVGQQRQVLGASDQRSPSSSADHSRCITPPLPVRKPESYGSGAMIVTLLGRL